MEHEHLDEAALERLLALNRTEDQNRSLLHQIAICPQCNWVGGWLLRLYRSGDLSLRFGPEDLALPRSRAEASGLWERLAYQSQKKRLALIRSRRRFASWGLCELFCHWRREAAPDEVHWADQLAELAVAVAEAASLLPKIPTLSEEHGGELGRIRLRWVEGRIAADLGDRDTARQAFEEVRQAFLSREIAYGAAFVSLDLAVLAIEQGRTPEVRDLARETVAVFRPQDIPQEALDAVRLFKLAADLDAATVELARKIAALLQQALLNPGTRLEMK